MEQLVRWIVGNYVKSMIMAKDSGIPMIMPAGSESELISIDCSHLLFQLELKKGFTC